MKRKKNGFTLIELLGVLVILALLLSFAAPYVLNALNAGKNSSYDIMVNNILTASKMYYEECRYGDIYDGATKVECGSDVTLTLGALANAGLLSGISSEECTGGTCTFKTIVKNPKTDTDISSCQIKIRREIDTNGKVTYVVDSLTNGNDCPVSEYSYSYTGNVDGKVLGVTN